MAVTLAIVAKSDAGSGYETYADITGPASYTTGGEVLTAAQVNQLLPNLGGGALLADISKVTFMESETNTGAQYIILDRTNQKIMFFAGSTQVGAATNLSAVTIRVRLRYGQANLG